MNSAYEEHVVLVNEQNEPIGTARKATVHTINTPRHRGFSVFVFNRRGEILLQQRSGTKKTWPLAWSNSCCGHPGVGESSEQAAGRRLHDELGIEVENVTVVLPDYRYHAAKDGVVENEFCPVIVALADAEPVINPDEVAAVRWIEWQSFVRECREHPDRYSPWCVEETLLLDASSKFQELLRAYAKE